MPRISLLVMFLTVSNMVFGQWSSDPDVNLDVFPEYNILDASKGFTSTGCRDGSVYITAFSIDTTLLVTMLNAEGIRSWRNGVIRVKYPTPYAFISFTDSQNNLYLCYTKHYGGLQNGFDWNILKINKQGEFCWGENGLSIFFPNNRINWTPYKWTVNENGDVFLFSMQSNTNITTDRYYAVYRIDKDGNFTWGQDGLVLDDMVYPWHYVPRNIIPTSDGGILVMFQQEVGLYHNTDYEIYVRKYDLNGKRTWEKSPMIYRGYSSYNSVRTYSDQNDGFYFTCSSSVIQHVKYNGSLDWEGGGVQLGDSLSWYSRPCIIGFNSHGDILFHYKYAAFGNQRELKPHSQIVSESGDLVIPGIGLPLPIPEFAEYDFDYSDRYLAKLNGDTVYHFYSDPIQRSFNIAGEIKCYPTTFDQKSIWENSLILAQGQEVRSSLRATPFVNGQSVIAWVSFLESGEVRVKSQNMHADGTLGNKSTAINEFQLNKKLRIIFNPANRTIVLPEERSQYKYQLLSITGKVIQGGQVETVIPLRDIKPGLYVIRIWDGVNPVSQKILIQ